MKFQNFLNLLAMKITSAKAFIVLRKDGTWEYMGMPEDLFPNPPDIEEEMQNHVLIPDDRIDAWWIN